VRLAFGAIAIAVILLVLQDAFEVMLLPRRVQRRTRFAAIYFRMVWRACSRLASRLSPRRGREGVLSQFGALSMLGLFASWATSLIVGFGVLEWALQPLTGRPGHEASLGDQLYLSGVTFFTLGYGDVVPHSHAGKVVAVLEAGVGLGFIAVVISYLPLIHQFFSRREVLVIRLDGRAGSPPTAAALLSKHAGALDDIDAFLREWEVWGGELLEGHLSYPMLAYYRSQHDNQSWLAALTAVIDCCALILVGVDGAKTFQARMTFGMMRQVAVEMARSFRIAPSRYEGRDRLPPEDYQRLVAILAASGLALRTEDEARVSLQALRATYEPMLDGLARYLMLTIPEWVPKDDAQDHWTRGHRGLLAHRLIEQLERQSAEPPSEQSAEHANIWRRIRARLR
jgi:nitrate reductase NapE component